MEWQRRCQEPNMKRRGWANYSEHFDSTLLPEHIRHKLEHKNNIRAQTANDPSISKLNSEITYLIQTHKSDIWREHLDTLGSQTQHAYSLEDNTWICNNKKSKKKHNHFQRENIHLTHTDSNHSQQTIVVVVYPLT